MKKLMLYLFAFIVVFCMVILLYINLHPVFGRNPSKELKKMYEKFNNYVDGTFVNLVPTTMNLGGVSGGLSLLRDAISGGQDRNPDDHIPVTDINWPIINNKEDSLTWFGHSAFLLSIDQKKILVDPMLGPVASPVPFAGSKRYSEDMLHIIDDMPPIDAVFITHDHYDHLDYPSILKLKNNVEHFFVPYGVGAHLIRWGVEEEKISELNWWDETKFKGLTIAFTPSKHFSGRGLINRNSTLWGGWIILGNQTRFYTSGDGGYDSHFEEIGKKYGPFHITLMEGGQYDRRWDWVHMTPEEAVQAHLDVNGENMMLIHWGAFTLAYHGWTEPIERALEAAGKEDVNMLAPSIGETVILDGQYSKPESLWWES